MKSAGEMNRRYFREAYRSGVHGWGVEEPSAYAVRNLRRIAKEQRGGRMLDIGCGEGRHAIAAAKMGFKAVGIDFEELALERARRFARAVGAARVEFRKADALKMPFKEGEFDVVMDYGCLHHQRKTDWGRYKASLLRVLKERGYYVLSVFSPRFRMFRGSRRRWHVAHGAYRRNFTAKEIERLFGQEFEVMEMVEEKGEGGGFWHVLMRRRGGTDQCKIGLFT